MSKRQDDIDEYCDPENPRHLKYEDVVAAATRIEPFIPKTPCVLSHYKKQFTMHLHYKLETIQPTGSVKDRGALNVLNLLPLDKKKIGVIVAALANEASAMSYAAKKLNIPITIVCANTVPISKLQKSISNGAKVFVQGSNLMEVQKSARIMAKEKKLSYINGRDHPHVLSGLGTVALEILEEVPLVDAVLVPVGSGGLLAAVAAVIKHVKPQCLVYGVQPENMAAMFNSLDKDAPVTVLGCSSMADTIAVPNVGVNSFYNVKPLVDKVLLVKEDWIARAVLHLVEKERVISEGAGACGLAAVIGHLVPELKTKTVVCIISGGNIDALLLSRYMERALAAEGRLLKFRLGLDDTSYARTQLMRLIANGGYNLLQIIYDPVWVEGDSYKLEARLVVECKNLEHGLELKRIIDRAYQATAIFETEPFNDKRVCPCYVHKTLPMY